MLLLFWTGTSKNCPHFFLLCFWSKLLLFVIHYFDRMNVLLTRMDINFRLRKKNVGWESYFNIGTRHWTHSTYKILTNQTFSISPMEKSLVEGFIVFSPISLPYGKLEMWTHLDGAHMIITVMRLIRNGKDLKGLQSEKERFHPLVNLPNDCNSQGWARHQEPPPGLPCAWRGPRTWANLLCFSCAARRELDQSSQNMNQCLNGSLRHWFLISKTSF